MRIPSYDDLTPSIPDISIRDTFARVEHILPPRAPRPAAVEPASPEDAGAHVPLFACLRSANTPETTAAIARDFSPRIERRGGGCVVLDVSGLGRLLGDAQAIGGALDRAAAERAAGITVSVARTQVAAMLMAIAHRGLVVAAGDAAAAVADLPMAALQPLVEALDGTPIGAKAAARAKATAGRLETFKRWGLETVGEVAALPSAELSERMGQPGLRLQRLARGLDPAPLVPDPGVPRFVQSIDLEWPIDALEPLSFVLARLLDPLSAALERADRAAAALRLDLRLVDRTTHQRVLQLPAAIRDGKVLRTLLLLDLESHPPAAAIDVVSIEIDPAPSRIIQYSLLERSLPTPETLATLTARLTALVGESRCGAAALLDTHRPDGFEMRRFAPSDRMDHGSRGASDRMDLGSRGAAVPSDRMDHGSRGAVLRRFRPPIAVRVTIERGRPVHVAIDRRGMPGGRVAQHAGPWRTSGAWWDASATHWDRDEWDVAFADGAICRLFHDRVMERWFMEAVMD